MRIIVDPNVPPGQFYCLTEPLRYVHGHIQITDQLLEDAMNAQCYDPISNKYYDPVEEAERQLKAAKAAAKAQRRAQKAADKRERQRQADRELTLETLRGIVADPHNTPAERQHAGDRLLSLS